MECNGEGREMERGSETGVSRPARMQPAKSEREALSRLGLDEMTALH